MADRAGRLGWGLGVLAGLVLLAAPVQAADLQYATDHFIITYTDVVDDILPYGMEAPAGGGDLKPAYVVRLAAELERVRTVLHDQYGFRSDEITRRVYVTLHPQATHLLRRGEHLDGYSDDELNSIQLSVRDKNEAVLAPERLFPVAAHEYFHLVQREYRILAHSLSGWSEVLKEGTAGWLEVALYQRNPMPGESVAAYGKGLLATADNMDYGSALFFVQLERAYGSRIVSELWEEYRQSWWATTSGGDAIDAVLQAHGSSLPAEFSRFAEALKFDPGLTGLIRQLRIPVNTAEESVNVLLASGSRPIAVAGLPAYSVVTRKVELRSGRQDGEVTIRMNTVAPATRVYVGIWDDTEHCRQLASFYAAGDQVSLGTVRGGQPARAYLVLANAGTTAGGATFELTTWWRLPAVTGTVVEAGTRNPVAGATVALAGPARASLVTGADGGFRSEPLAAGNYTYRVEAAGCLPATGSFRLGAAGETLTVTLRPAIARGAVTVVDRSGPVPGATVTVSRGPESLTGTTDRTGAAAFELRTGSWSVAASAPGHDDARGALEVRPRTGGALTLTLERLRGRATVRVMTEAGWVGGATVRLRQGRTELTGTTLPDGYASFDLPVGTWRATAAADGYAGDAGDLQVEAGAENGLVLTLRRKTGTVAVRVIDRSDRAVAGARVTIDGVGSATTDAAGTAVFAAVPVGYCPVAAAADPAGSGSAGAIVEEGKRVEVTVLLSPRPGSLTVRVMHEDDWAANVPVTVTGPGGSRTGTTLPDGYAHFADLLPGDWQVAASADRYGADAGTVRVESGREAGIMLLLKPRPAQLTVAVTRSGNRPVVGAAVAVERLGNRTTDAGGKAVFAGVPPGDYRGTVQAREYRSAAFTVVLGSGKEETVRVVLAADTRPAAVAAETQSIRVCAAVPSQNSDAFKSNRVAGLEVATTTFDRVPYLVAPAFTRTITRGAGQRCFLAGNAAGTAGWSVDNFLFVEIASRRGTERFVVGQADPVRKNGVLVRHQSSGFSHTAGEVDLTPYLPENEAATVTILALDYGVVGYVSNLFLIVR